MTKSLHAVALLVPAALLPLAGCAGSITSLFSPDFLAALAVGPQVADQPGDAPSVLVEVENQTSRTIEVRVSWRDDEGTASELVEVLVPGDKIGEAVICPMPEVTFGDVADLERPGAIIRLGDGGPNEPFIEVEPFGVLLREEVNYDCGDTVRFTVVPSGDTLSGFRTFAFVERAN